MAPEAEEPKFCKEQLFQTRLLAHGPPEGIQMQPNHWVPVQAGPLDSARDGCYKWVQGKAGSLLLEPGTGHDICKAMAGGQSQIAHREDS